jgi:hypothetical protein
VFVVAFECSAGAAGSCATGELLLPPPQAASTSAMLTTTGATVNAPRLLLRFIAIPL